YFASSLFLAAGELQLGPRLGRQNVAEAARLAPVQGAERAATLAHRAPAGMLRRAGRAAPGAISRRRGGAGEPVVPLRRVAVRAFLDLGHQTADADRRMGACCILQMPSRLAPQTRVERALCQREMALYIVRLLRRQPAR